MTEKDDVGDLSVANGDAVLFSYITNADNVQLNIT
jgi:hypothetical protein